jgi:glycine cleavage system H protein
LVNKEPYEGGWMVKIEMADPDQADDLLSASDYKKLIE